VEEPWVIVALAVGITAVLAVLLFWWVVGRSRRLAAEVRRRPGTVFVVPTAMSMQTSDALRMGDRPQQRYAREGSNWYDSTGSTAVLAVDGEGLAVWRPSRHGPVRVAQWPWAAIASVSTGRVQVTPLASRLGVVLDLHDGNVAELAPTTAAGFPRRGLPELVVAQIGGTTGQNTR
jgi:hypothetical protein